MKILFVTSYMPVANGGGSAIRSFNFIKRLADKHSISLLGLSTGSDFDEEAIAKLEAQGVEAISVPLHWSESATGPEKLRRLGGRLPYQVQPFANPQTRSVFQGVLVDFRPDIVHVDLLRMAWFIRTIAGRMPVVLDMHNVESQRFRSEQGQTRLSLRHRILADWEYLRLRRFETWACRRATWVATVTPQDAEALHQLAGHDRVKYVPVGIDTDYFQPFPDCADPTLIFAGSMFYYPNVDAMLYFYRQILPLIAAQISNVRMLIVGRDPAPEILTLANDPQVEVTGTVSDVRPYFARSAVCVIPVRIGGGIKQKLLEAMALGMPIVTTSFSCIGIPLTPDEHVLVRDTPESFAEGVATLLNDAKKRRQLGEAAAQFIRKHYSWERSLALLENVYQEAIKFHNSEEKN